MSSPEEQKKKNLRTGLILASVVLVFFFGFMARMIFFGK
ncbi:MAG: cytochrome oxidase small assembly protein [Brachymonas sp.]